MKSSEASFRVARKPGTSVFSSGILLRRSVVAALSVFLGPLAWATGPTVYTWLGNDTGSISTGTNWDLTTTPVPGSKLVFKALSPTTLTFDASLDVDGLEFSGSFPAYSLVGSNSAALGVGAGGIKLINDLGGSSITIGDSLPIALTANQTWSIDSPLTLTANSVISGSASLTKSGNGLLLLTAANTYTGGTTVTDGTLQLSATGFLPDTTAVDLTISDATLDLGAHTGDTVTIGSLSGVAGTSVVLRSSGQLKLAGVSSTTFSGRLDGTPDAALIKEGAGTTFTLDGGSASNVGTLIVNGGSIRLATDGTLDSGTDITVNANGTLEIAANQTTRALTGAGAVVIEDGYTFSVNLPYSGAGSTATFSGTITDLGSGLLVKDGPGTFTFTGQLDHTSAQASSLSTSGGRRSPRGYVPPAPVLEVKSGTFQLGDGEQNGSVLGDIRVAGNLVFQTGSGTTFDYKLTGNGTVTKAGTTGSTLTLTGDNTTFGGTLSITRGTLAINPTAFNDSSTLNADAKVIVGTSADSATFALGSNAASYVQIASLEGDGSVTLASGKWLGIGGSSTTTYAGAISGEGGLAKLGASTLTLTGANTYAGGTTVKGGTLAVGGDNASLSHPDADLEVDGPTSDPQAWLKIFGGATVTTHDATLGAHDAGYALLSGTDSHSSQGSRWSTHSLLVGGAGKGSLQLADGAQLTVGDGSGTVILGNSTNGSGLLLIGSDDAESPAGGGYVNAATITTGAGSGTVRIATNSGIENSYFLTKTGEYNGTPVTISGAIRLENTAGYTILKGANTYTGSTLIKNSTLVVDVANALPTTTRVGLENSGTLKLYANQTVEGFLDAVCESVNSSIVLDTDTHGNPFTLHIAPATSANGDPGKFIGRISGGGSLDFTGPADESLSLTLSGNNSYTGGTSLSQGLLIVDGAATTGLGTGPVAINTAGILGLDYGATITNKITFNGSDGNRAFIGGFGTLAPDDQALLVGNHAGLSPGAKLDPSRLFSESNAVPPVGTLTLGVAESPTSVTFASGGRYDWGVQSTAESLVSDQLAITGSLTFTATSTTPFTFKLFTFNSSGSLAPLSTSLFDVTQNRQWTIITTTGGISGLTLGTNGLVTSDNVLINADNFDNLPYKDAFSLRQSGNSLFLDFNPAAVPEPSTWALLVTGLAVVSVTALRRRRAR